MQKLNFMEKEFTRYYCVDLLWGQKLYQELRFVLLEMNGVQSILASTSLALDPLSIIRLYTYRVRVECVFRELKQQMDAFCYRFCSKYMLRLSYYHKRGETLPLEHVENEKNREKDWKLSGPHTFQWPGQFPVLQWELFKVFPSGQKLEFGAD